MTVASVSRMATADYYLEMTQSLHPATEYYTGGLEPDGVWYNPGGFLDIADGSTVTPKDFKKLFDGYSPDGKALTQNSGKKTRAAGLDITFSLDKSFSAFWATANKEEREQLLELNDLAVVEALDYLQDNASFSRRGKGGAVMEKSSFIASSFQHSTSREQDPQLHTHVTIFNVGFRQDGTTGSLDQPAFYRHARTAAAIQGNAFARLVREQMGLAIEQHGSENQFIRLKGFPNDLEELWSKRRKTILSRVNELGVNPSTSGAITSKIAVVSRPNKVQDNTPDQLLERFRSEALELGYSREEIQELLSRDLSFSMDDLKKDLLSIPDKLLENEAVFQELEFVKKFNNELCGRVAADQEKELFDWLKKERSLIWAGVNSKGERVYTTPEMTFAELSVKDLSRELSGNSNHKIPLKDVEKCLHDLKMDKKFLSVEQVNAFRYVTNGSGAISVMEGAAGAGKSTVLSSIADLYKDQGYEVLGTSTMWVVARDLGNDCDIDSYAIDSLLPSLQKGHRSLTSKTVLIVDEVGTLSTRKGRELLKEVQKAGAKIILSGDREQQQAVEAGSFLRLSQSVERGVRIDRIRRQRATVEDILLYNNKSGKLDVGTVRLQEQMMSKSDKQALIDRYAGTVERYGNCWQREASTHFKKGEALQGIAQYQERGRVRFAQTQSAVIWKLANEWMDWTLDNPEKTSLIQARTNQEVREISQAVRKLMKSHGLLADKEYSIDVAGNKKGQTNKLIIAKGDHFVFGARNDDLGVYNGTKGVITDISRELDGSLKITAKVNSREISFKPEDIVGRTGEICLKDGYASTIYSGQGKTVDAAFNLVDHNLARENLYSAATRHRDEAYFYVARDLGEEVVRADRSEELQDKPVKEQEILEAYAERWSNSRQKELVHDYLNPFSLEHYENLRSLAQEGEDISTLLATDILKREENRLKEITALTFSGEELEARIAIGNYGAARAEVAALGQVIKDGIGEEGAFYEHPDYSEYQGLRRKMDEFGTVLINDFERHRDILEKIYPNVKEDQLRASRERHKARELVGKWREAFEDSKEATADRLAEDILSQVRLEKENKSLKHMTSAVREEDFKNIWDHLYRGSEDHRERKLREGLSTSECRDRDLVLDYRRSNIAVGRVYSKLKSLAADGQSLSDHQGYVLLEQAVSKRDRAALEARSVDNNILSDFSVDREKLERRAALGEARSLVSDYELQAAKGSVEQRDKIAEELLARFKSEKQMAMELGDVRDPSEKATLKAIMEKRLEWKELFAQASQHDERLYLATLSTEERSLHRDAHRYKVLEREVGQHYSGSIKEAQHRSVDREETDSWKIMTNVAAQRDRAAHTLAKNGSAVEVALKHYGVDQGKFQARVDRVEASDLLDRYQRHKFAGESLEAGQVAADILAKVHLEKSEQQPKVTAREIFSRELDWKELKAERRNWDLEIEKSLIRFEKAYPDIKNNLSKYQKESDRLFNMNKRITFAAKSDKRFEIENTAYPEWYQTRQKFNKFGLRVEGLKEEIPLAVKIHYKDVLQQIAADIREYSHIERRHKDQEQKLGHRYKLKAQDIEQDKTLERSNKDRGYSW